MIKIIKTIKQFFMPELETSTLSEPASMSNPCDTCENAAKCCHRIGKFQRNEKNDGEL